MSGRVATASDLRLYAEIWRAVDTSSQVPSRKLKAPCGAKPIECSTPSRPSTCSRKRSARVSRCSWSATSSSMTAGVSGSRLAIVWVIFIVRPNEVRTTVAPSCWAIFATWNAIELSMRTPVMRSFLPSRIPMPATFSSGWGRLLHKGFHGIRHVCRVVGSVPHAEPAVDGDHRTGDVGGVVARDEADDGRDLLGRREAARGDVGEVGLLLVVREDGGHLRVDEAGGDDVGRDAATAELARDGARETDETGLRRGVVRLARRAVEADDAADEDDAPATLADHAGGGAAGAAERAGEVRVDDGVELLVAHPHQEGVAGDARVGDEHLHGPAEDLLRGGEGGVDRRRVGDLAQDALQPLRRFPGAVGDDDVVARVGEGSGDRQADATVASGHEHVARLGR